MLRIPRFGPSLRRRLLWLVTDLGILLLVAAVAWLLLMAVCCDWRAV